MNTMNKMNTFKILDFIHEHTGISYDIIVLLSVTLFLFIVLLIYKSVENIKKNKENKEKQI